MDGRSKKYRQIILVTAIAIVLSIAIPIIINEAYKKNEGYLTVWQGADVLSYTGGIFSFLGTIVLGVIAWQQNTRLLRIEENSFLASNASSALFTEVVFTGIKQQAVNFESHEEQILFTRSFDENTYWTDGGSITFICKLEPFDKRQHIAMVNVKQIDMLCSTDRSKSIDTHFNAANSDARYTKVAMSKEYDQFELTVLLTKAEKEKLMSTLTSADSMIQIEMILSLLTDKYVATELKCRATLNNPDYDEKEGVYNHFKTTEEAPPICFWSGASLKNKQEIVIKSISEEKTNGQA